MDTMDVEYYKNRFDVLSDVVKKLKEKLKRESEDGNLNLRDSAVFAIIDRGTEDYLGDIDHTDNAEIKCRQYRRLIAAINTALHSIMNETLVSDEEKSARCLNVYREYLQEVENTFRKFHIRFGCKKYIEIFTNAYA